MKRIRQVILDDVPEGISLALDVVGPEGKVLLRKNTLLTNDNIALLKKKRIGKVSILIDDGTSPGQEYERIAQILDHQFRKMGNDPDMQKLKSIIVEYKAKGWVHRH